MGTITSYIQQQMTTDQKYNHEHLFPKIQKIFFSKYQGEQLETIYQLASIWNEKDFKKQDLQKATQIQYHNYYKQVILLSARVYRKAQQFIKAIKEQPSASQQQQKIKFLLDLAFSYDRYFFKKKTFYEDSDKYVGTSTYLKEALQLLQKSKISHLRLIFNFMVQLEIIVNPNQKKQLSNSFILKMERIPKEKQKKNYLQSMSFPFLQRIKSWNEKTDKQQVLKVMKYTLPNYYFYTSSSKNAIHQLHTRQKDYKFLEQRHDYIQHMFPNHYGSDFNQSAQPLNYLEKQLFLEDRKAGLNMLHSIGIFFDFMGLRIDQNSQKLQVCDKKRLKDVLINNTHNHLRLMRILACLSVIGLRKIALKLIEFLDMASNKIFPELKNKFKKSWQIYGNDKDNIPLQTAKQMCFLEMQDFPQDHPALQGKFGQKQKENIAQEQIQNFIQQPQ